MSELPAVGQIQMGHQLLLLHTFTCLHHKNVLSLSEAAESFEMAFQSYSAQMPEGTQMVLRTFVEGLKFLAGQGFQPDPKGPPKPMRPDLHIIQGGRTD